jgi:hypothetical protein
MASWLLSMLAACSSADLYHQASASNENIIQCNIVEIGVLTTDASPYLIAVTLIKKS